MVKSDLSVYDIHVKL